MLKKYSPKNEQEKEIVNKIINYAPDSKNYYWWDNDFSEQYKNTPPIIFKYKLGPFEGNKFIYIKSYVVNLNQFTNKLPEYVTIRIDISNALKKLIVYAYYVNLPFNYKNNISQNNQNKEKK